MKKTIIILSILMTIALCSATSRSNGFAGSFMMRANTTDAIFWNPANLVDDKAYMELPFTNFDFAVSNNAFTIDTYNSVAGQMIDVDLKDKLMKDLNGALVLKARASVQEFAWSDGKTGLGLRTHYALNSRFSEEYIRLALYGNTQNYYEFDEKNNNIDMLSYMDLAWSYGGLSMPYVNDYFPATWGVTLSTLIGINSVETKEYSGHFSNGLEGDEINGADFVQDITLISSTGGIGYKGLLGLALEPVENLNLGMTFDNLFAKIYWELDNQEIHYIVHADSIFILDLDEDFYSEEQTNMQISKRSTKLPFEFALGSKYSYKKSSLSMDYRQATKSSAFTSDKPDISLGFETMWAAMPIQLGIRFGNSTVPMIFAWGLGYRSDTLEFGINIQSYDSFIPGDDSKGTAIGIHWRTRI